MTTLTPEREAEIRAFAAHANRVTFFDWADVEVAQRGLADLLAALDATRAELADYTARMRKHTEGLSAQLDRARHLDAARLREIQAITKRAHKAEADASMAWATAGKASQAVAEERDAHARDLALLAEVRGHCELREVLATAEQTRRYLAGLAEQWGRENLEDQAVAWALLVRLLRGEG